MKNMLSILACTLVIGFGAASSNAWAQAKSAKTCTDEWRADKAGFQAKGVTEKAYVADCRAGKASTPAAAPAPKAAAPKPMAPTATTIAGQKTAKDCTEEWRADKAGFQAKGITVKAYVADCRAGKASTPAAAPAPAPKAATPAPAAAPSAPAAPRPTAAPAQAPVAPTARTAPTGSPSGAKQFATEAQATATCPADTIVWVNLPSKIYHFKGTHNYGTTKNGAYMCEKDTAAQGIRAAKNEQHP